MMNEEDDPEQRVRFKPSESRLAAYLVAKEGSNVSFDIDGAMHDIVAVLKMAQWDEAKFLEAAKESWRASEIVFTFPSEEKQ